MFVFDAVKTVLKPFQELDVGVRVKSWRRFQALKDWNVRHTVQYPTQNEDYCDMGKQNTVSHAQSVLVSHDGHGTTDNF